MTTSRVPSKVKTRTLFEEKKGALKSENACPRKSPQKKPHSPLRASWLAERRRKCARRWIVRELKRCSYRRRKLDWKECSLCPHGKLKSNCVVCTACPDSKQKNSCAVCSPCPHGKRKSTCAKCYPCPHGKLKYSCAACKSARAGQHEIKQEPEPFTIRGYFGIGE